MRRPRGAVNLVNLTLLAVVVSAVYLAWLYVPLLLDEFDVEEALAAGAGQLTQEVRALDDVGVQQLVVRKLSKVGTHWEDQDGKRVEVPGLDITPEDVQVERSSDGRTGKVTLDYARTVKLKPLERYWTFRFHSSRESTLR